MNERGIERLMRGIAISERGPLDPPPLENVVRVVAILILVLLVFFFATWQGEDTTEPPPMRAEQPVALPVPPAWGGTPEAATRIGALEYSPLY
jgi:hypothetical protein